MSEIAGQAQASGSAIYDMVHCGPGTHSLDRAHDAAKQQVALQELINRRVRKIVDKMSGGWAGNASEGAQAAAEPLREGALRSSEALAQAQRAHSDQGGQFVHLRDSVENLPDGPPETNVIDSLSPWDTDTEDAVHDYNNKSSRNVELLSGYGKHTDGNQTALPRQYPEYAPFTGQFSVASKDGPGGGSVHRPPEPTGGTHVAGYGPPVGGGPGAAPPGFHGGPAPGGGPPLPSSPGGGGSVGAGTLPGGGSGTGGAPATSGPGVTGPGGTGGFAGAPLPGRGGDAVRGGRGFGGARGAPGAGGSPGVGRPGGLGAGAPGQAGGQQAGGRVAAGPGAAAAAEAAAARGAAGAPAGRAGAGGMPMGAGTGRGDDDKEHKRADYLIERDEEGVFGTDQPTVPPVIGDEPR